MLLPDGGAAGGSSWLERRRERPGCTGSTLNTSMDERMASLIGGREGGEDNNAITLVMGVGLWDGG